MCTYACICVCMYVRVRARVCVCMRVPTIIAIIKICGEPYFGPQAGFLGWLFGSATPMTSRYVCWRIKPYCTSTEIADGRIIAAAPPRAAPPRAAPPLATPPTLQSIQMGSTCVLLNSETSLYKSPFLSASSSSFLRIIPVFLIFEYFLLISYFKGLQYSASINRFLHVFNRENSTLPKYL